MHQLAAAQFWLDGQPGHQRDSVAQTHVAFDSLQAGQLHANIERRLVNLKDLNNALAQGRGDVVSYKILCPQFADGHFGEPRQRVGRTHDKRRSVRVNRRSLKKGRIWPKGNDAKLDGALQQMLGDAAGQRALYSDPNLRAYSAELIEHGEQVEAGVFIGCDDQTAPFQRLQLLDGNLGLSAQA